MHIYFYCNFYGRKEIYSGVLQIISVMRLIFDSKVIFIFSFNVSFYSELYVRHCGNFMFSVIHLFVKYKDDVISNFKFEITTS